ncbi:hypothetical protein EON83_18400 [bacterium]|nr:MAG: hypothetical protein EON83_18400 [bacterium]
MKFSSRRHWLFTTVAASVVLAGCGNSPYPAGLTGQSVYFLSQADDPRKLDPASSYRASEGAILDVICSSYYDYQPLKTKNFQLILGLGASEAKRAPYTYTDAKTKKPRVGEQWTFKVRRDLKFANDACFPGGMGRAITAKDFIYAFRRMADPAAASPVQGFFTDKIIGFDDLIARNGDLLKKGEGADYKTPVPGLQLDQKDPYTFRINLNQPYPQMRYLMAMHFTSPMAYESVDYYGKDIVHHPIGCGPFILEEWTPKRRIVLAKNPNRPAEYYPSEGDPGDKEAGLLANAGKQLPLVDKVVVSNITESTTGWNLFLQGYMDGWSVTQSNYQQVVSQQGSLTPEMQEHGIRLTKSSDVGVTYFAFNMRDPIFGGYTTEKRKLRQAVSLAVNSQEFIELFSQGNGRAAQTVVPPGIYGYDPKYRNPFRAYDPKLTRAKELLKEAGYPNGLDARTGERLTLYYDNAKTDAAGRQYVALISRQIQALGLRLESRSQRDVVWQSKIDGNDWQMTDYGWLADYPDPENFVFLLYGPNRRPGPNLTGYDNPVYNRLFEKMRAMDDGPERLKLIEQMRAISDEDCPLIYIQNSQKLSLAYDWLSDFKPNPVTNTALKYRSVDGEKRAERQRQWNKPVWWPLAAMFAVLIAGTLPAIQVVKNRHRRRVTHKD